MNIPFHSSELTVNEQQTLTHDFQLIMETGRFTEGRFTESLEAIVKEISGFSHAVAFSSATAALYCALRSTDVIKEGNNGVITSPVNWIAAKNAIEVAGGFPIFDGVDENGQMVSIDGITILPGMIVAAMPVTLYGQKMDFSNCQLEVPIILDAAHSINQLNRLPEGADIYCFSLHPTKLFFAGEGGFAITNNALYSEMMKLLRWQGMKRGVGKRWKKTLKFTISEFAAACGYRTLRNFKFRVDDLKEKIYIYQREFSRYGWDLQLLGDKDVSMVTIKVNSAVRDDLLEFLKKYKIDASVKYRSVDDNKAESFCDEIVTLPCYRTMTPIAIEDVVETIWEFSKKIGGELDERHSTDN